MLTTRDEKMSVDNLVNIEFHKATKDLIIKRQTDIVPDSEFPELQRTRIFISAYNDDLLSAPPINTSQYIMNMKEGWRIQLHSPPKKETSLSSTILHLLLLGAAGATPGYLLSNDIAMALGGSIGATIGFIVPERRKIMNTIGKYWFESKYGLRKHKSAQYEKEQLFITRLRRQTGGKVPVDNQIRAYMGFRETYKRIFPLEQDASLEAKTVQIASVSDNPTTKRLLLDSDGSVLALSLAEAFLITKKRPELKIEGTSAFEDNSKDVKKEIENAIYAPYNRLYTTTAINFQEHLETSDGRDSHTPLALVQVDVGLGTTVNYLIESDGGEYSLLRLE